MYIVGLLQTLPKSASGKFDSMMRDNESDLLLSTKCFQAQLNILPVPSQYILSLLLLITKNKGQFMTNSQIHRITTRQASDLYVPAANLTVY